MLKNADGRGEPTAGPLARTFIDSTPNESLLDPTLFGKVTRERVTGPKAKPRQPDPAGGKRSYIFSIQKHCNFVKKENAQFHEKQG